MSDTETITVDVDPDYQNGKIYKVFSPHEPNLIYIGSTYFPLEKRFDIHF